MRTLISVAVVVVLIAFFAIYLNAPHL